MWMPVIRSSRTLAGIGAAFWVVKKVMIGQVENLLFPTKSQIQTATVLVVLARELSELWSIFAVCAVHKLKEVITSS